MVAPRSTAAAFGIMMSDGALACACGRAEARPDPCYARIWVFLFELATAARLEYGRRQNAGLGRRDARDRVAVCKGGAHRCPTVAGYGGLWRTGVPA